jgi:serine/threonine protein kinase
MTCFEVLTGKSPFGGWRRPEDVRLYILEGKHLVLPSYIPSLLKDLVERCWALDPADRPTFRQIRDDLKRCKLYYAWPSDD